MAAVGRIDQPGVNLDEMVGQDNALSEVGSRRFSDALYIGRKVVLRRPDVRTLDAKQSHPNGLRSSGLLKRQNYSRMHASKAGSPEDDADAWNRRADTSWRTGGSPSTEAKSSSCCTVSGERGRLPRRFDRDPVAMWLGPGDEHSAGRCHSARPCSVVVRQHQSSTIAKDAELVGRRLKASVTSESLYDAAAAEQEKR